MRNWELRATEVAYLLNPAFCGRIIYNVIKTYFEETKRPMPFLLVYLILPLVLHKRTREIINSATQMQVWIQRNPEVLIGFAERTNSMIKVTNEAVEFLLQNEVINLTNKAELEQCKLKKSLSTTKYTNHEIKKCISKSSSVAKWFSKAGTVETIYTCWGVRP